jgi:hypothetical protein
VRLCLAERLPTAQLAALLEDADADVRSAAQARIEDGGNPSAPERK